jgi:hypothetical protein
VIRAYVNRMGNGRGPVVVELWQDGERKARTFCQHVRFPHSVHVELKSVYALPQGGGFQGYGGPVHTWVQADTDAVAGMDGVTHAEGGVERDQVVMICRTNWHGAKDADGTDVVPRDPPCPDWRTTLGPPEASPEERCVADVPRCPVCGETGMPRLS